MKFAYRNREFWCKGYYVDTVGKNTKAIKESLRINYGIYVWQERFFLTNIG